ncbi:hypothetical protein [Burkholderia cenocepacia]|uniref:hypothetical protein n=1 Tax=Burkholderia cenocepacia TaxID=95486 RepID=UPI002ABE2711|nr:hypothetical protein [Burkholderia cenocepacia]
MHPKAVTLMLAGLEPFRLKCSVDFIRVMRPTFKGYEQGLLCMGVCGWEFSHAPHRSEYQPTSWDSIDPNIWDALPDELLQRAIEGA